MRRSRGQFRVGGDRRARGRLAIAVIGLGLAGGLLHSEASRGGTGFPLAALLLLGGALAATMVSSVSPRLASVLRLTSWWRTGALVIAAALVAWVLREHPERPVTVSHTDLVVAWLLAMVFYWLAVVPPARFRSRGHRPERWGGARGLTPLLLAVLVLGAFVITAAPMIQVALRSPRDFSARTDATSIFQSGWLVAEAQARGQAPVRVFAEYASHALLAFNLYPDLSSFYALPQPLLDPVFGVLFLFGLGYATVRALGRGPHRRFVPLVAWWWSGMCFGGVLTIGAPSSQRLITLAVPTCFFIALALQRLGRLLRAAVSGIPLNAVLAVATLLFGVMSIKTYFVDFSPLRLYGGEHAQIATITAPIAAALGPQYDAYLAGAPDIFWGLPTFGFLAPDIDGHDLIAPLTASTVPVMTPRRGGIFIFTASRQGEMATVRAAYPGGVESTFHVATDGRVLAVTYVVPATR